MIDSVLYVSGRGGTGRGGLGTKLSEFSREVVGFPIASDFWKLNVHQQVNLTKLALQSAEEKGAPVIANSYGAYLVLLSMIKLSPLRCRVMLLSPVIGKTVSQTGYFKPPWSRELDLFLQKGTLRANHIEAHVGELDEGYSAAAFQKFVRCIGANVVGIYKDQGHQLSHQLTTRLVKSFLHGEL